MSTDNRDAEAIPVTNTVNVSPDAGSIFPPTIKWILGASIFSFFMIIIFMDRKDNANNMKETIRDLKDSAKDDRRLQAEVADRAHKQFLDEQTRFREAATRQWEVMRLLGADVKTLAEECKKGNQINTENQREIKGILAEVKKIKTGGQP